MLSYMSSTKAKPKQLGQASMGHLNTYQDQTIRKSTCNTNQMKKEKTYRKVLTENSEKESAFESELKKMNKQFKLPVKASSPQVKRGFIVQNAITTNSKLCFSTNVGKIKRVKRSNGPTGQIEKMNTDTGPVIQKVSGHPNQKYTQQKTDKKNIIYREEKPAFLESKKENISNKKMLQSKSSGNLYVKARLNTQGTIDATPFTVSAFDIELIQLIGQGTFGKVHKGRIKKSGEFVAVKKVYQDPKYKNREVEIVNMLKGNFLMKVLGTYTTNEEGHQFLNIVMQFYQGDLFNYIKSNGKKGLSTFDIKLMTYQIFRGLMYIHSLKIAHRDIKPHNLLYKGKNVAICDFGSAKVLTNEPNLPYICSRCYRAPQLIFGATHYTTMIDIWSVGCVILQMINSTPLFIGQSSIDHLIEIIKVLGTPTKSQVIDMNPEYDLNDYKFPKVKKREWIKIFPKADELLLDLISQIMIYSPKQRLNAAEAIAHEFFDQLREEDVYRTLVKKYNLNLFSFSEEQLRGHEHLIPKLIPYWLKDRGSY